MVATYRRPDLLRRLLVSLEGETPALAGVVVVNNSGDEETAKAAATASVPVQLITPSTNLGTGGGLAEGLRRVLALPGATHAWIMDDDACAAPGALAAMLAAQIETGAEVASPLVPNEAGIVTWFPGPLAQPAWNVIRAGVTPEEFCRRCGTTPRQWNWATWASLLVSRRAIEAVGLPRTDFWYQATDIEYTLRLSARFHCVLAPAAVCPHLPPPESVEQRRRKDLWSLQNNAFLSFRLRHGWRALRHLPGNHYRYWARHRGTKALTESIRALWRGAVLGRPVGADDYFATERKAG